MATIHLAQRPRRGLCLAAAAALVVAACTSTSPTPSPRPSVTAPPVLPTPTATPAPTPTATPAATPTMHAVGGWQAAGSMAVGRVSPQAVRLADGRVLVVGTEWQVNEGDMLTAELYDPGSDSWTRAPDLPKARTAFALVALADGRALVAGGLNDRGQSYSSAYVLEPGADAWQKVGLLGAARTSASAVLLPNGRVLIAGGYYSAAGTASEGGVTLAAARVGADGRAGAGPAPDDVTPDHVGPALATAELYDPATGAWTRTGSMRFARFGFALAVLADGRVLAVGTSSATCCGVDVDERAYDTAELYDPATGTWSAAGTLPGIDRAALEALGPAGANPIPATAPEPGIGGRLFAEPDGGALLLADGRYWKHQGEITRSFRFDAARAAWAEFGPTYVNVAEPGPPLAIAGVPDLATWTFARLPDGAFVGVENETGAAARLDPASGALTDLPGSGVGRTYPGVVGLADGSVLFIGGAGDDGVGLTSVDRFVP